MRFWEILKRYRLFFLIAVTFLIEALILLIVVPNVVQNEKLTIIELIIKHTTQLSILMLVTSFVYLFFAALLDIESKISGSKKEEEKSDFAGGVLTRLLIGSFSASTIPTGVSLVLCAFVDMKYIRHLSGVEIYIAFAGISLLSIAVLSTYEEKGRINKEIKKVTSSNVSDLTN